MAKRKDLPRAETSPGFETKTTVKSSDKAAAQQRRDDIRSGREDVRGKHYAGDDDSIGERYRRTLARLDATIGRAQAEKRKVLSALIAIRKGDPMGAETETFRETEAGQEFAPVERDEKAKKLGKKVEDLYSKSDLIPAAPLEEKDDEDKPNPDDNKS